MKRAWAGTGRGIFSVWAQRAALSECGRKAANTIIFGAEAMQTAMTLISSSHSIMESAEDLEVYSALGNFRAIRHFRWRNGEYRLRNLGKPNKTRHSPDTHAGEYGG